MAEQLRPVIHQVGRSADAIETMGRDTARASSQAASAVVGVGQDLKRLTADTAPELQRLMAELQALTASLRRFSDSAERSPASLLFGRSPVPDGPGEANTSPATTR